MTAAKTSRRSLAWLTAAVLGAHAWLLAGSPLWNLHASAPGEPPVPSFQTRSITPPPMAPAALPAKTVHLEPAQTAPKAISSKQATRTSRPQRSNAIETTAPQVDTVAELADPTPAASAEAPEAVVPTPTLTPTPPASDSSPVAELAAAPSPASDASAAALGLQIQPPGAAPAAYLPHQVTVPAPVRLAFDVAGQAKRFDYSAKAELTWTHDGQLYEAKQEISAFLVGSRVQRSNGAVTPQGLQPDRFGDKSRSEQAAHFDYGKGRATFSANTPETPIAPGVQDRLSVFIQLGALMASDPTRFTPGTQISVTTLSARAADRWVFSIEGQEALDLPAGAIETWKLQRVPRKDYDQKAELWVAPALGYMPVRIRITQANGDFADLRLRSHGAP